MRVIVNFDRCESNAVCMATAPEVFRVDDEDNLHILQDDPPPDLRGKVEQAARSCPRLAIRVEN
jgi:ferredoxin